MPFASRFTPIPADQFGFQRIETIPGANTFRLIDALPDGLPQGANVAWLQTLGPPLRLLFIGISSLPFTTLYYPAGYRFVIPNGDMIRACYVLPNSVPLHVQFFTGREGSMF